MTGSSCVCFCQCYHLTSVSLPSLGLTGVLEKPDVHVSHCGNETRRHVIIALFVDAWVEVWGAMNTLSLSVRGSRLHCSERYCVYAELLKLAFASH